jgi:hypothetical protein
MPFRKGEVPRTAGIGRKRGVPNKVTGAVKDMVLAALDKAGGQDYLVEQAKKNPVAFMSLLGRILPMQVTGEGGGPVMIVTGVPRHNELD